MNSSRRPPARVPTRTQLIPRLRKYTPRTMNGALEYNARTDDNAVLAVETVCYTSVGSTRMLDAIANALEGQPSWLQDLGGSLSYLMFAHRMSYFWHIQFRLLFPDHPQPLRVIDWEQMATSMAHAFILGWHEPAVFHGYLTHAALNQDYQLRISYQQDHRRAHAFLLRLFASWRNDGVGHCFPEWAYTVPVYEELLKRWRLASADELGPLIERACEHHLSEARMDTSREKFDFGDDCISLVPLEILMIFRLREIERLQVPRVKHPLLATPFDRLPPPSAVPEPDEFMRGTRARARKDWPVLESVLSIAVVSEAAKRSG
jgi:hypothetical protein